MTMELKNQKCQACSGNTPNFDEKQIRIERRPSNDDATELLTAFGPSAGDNEGIFRLVASAGCPWLVC